MAELIEAGFDGPTTEPSVAGRARARLRQRCGGTGYKGRVGVFEVMEMTERAPRDRDRRTRR